MICSFCGSEMIEKVEYQDEEIKRSVYNCSNQQCVTEHNQWLKKQNEILKRDLKRF